MSEVSKILIMNISIRNHVCSLCKTYYLVPQVTNKQTKNTPKTYYVCAPFRRYVGAGSDRILAVLRREALASTLFRGIVLMKT